MKSPPSRQHAAPVPRKSGVASTAIGARVVPDGVRYRVWAPDLEALSVVVERDGTSRELRLGKEAAGYWSASDPDGLGGDLYRFKRPDGRLLPDVASRFQPQGVHGPSECIDPGDYRWRSASWSRPRWTGQTIYELHVGTFTPEGTYRTAAAKLDKVRDLGVEAIEIMPVADFAGDRNWGYDGVALYAPARCYGRPDDLRALIDAAHGQGLAVILDVVYNHLGPSGNYLADFCRDYFHTDRSTPWGSAFNLDGERGRPVRDFLLRNAEYWLDEFRFDGLRLDATHAIHDDSPRHLLSEITAAVHARGGFVIAEDERNDPRLARTPEGDGFGIDALWSDDFHHEIRVALTGTRHSYFGGYGGTAADVASNLARGWTYRGQPYGPWGGRARGSSGDHLPTRSFVFCIENHDQVGNRARGERLEHLVTPRQFRAASMLLCLSPYAAMIFMGQEWAASTPFLYFTDHGGELGGRISAGRRREFEENGLLRPGESFPDPEALETFTRSKLRWEERQSEGHAGVLALYRECLRERRARISDSLIDRRSWSVTRFGQFIAIRYRFPDGDRMLLAALREESFPEGPLPRELEAPSGHAWRAVIQSEAARFGGSGGRPLQDTWPVAGPGGVWLETVDRGPGHAAP